MKKFAILSVLAVVAACSEPAVEAEVEPVEEVVEVAEPLALDGQPSVGTYTVTAADGSVVTQEVKADGTFVNTAGENSQTGTWEQQSPEVFCTTSSEEGAVQECSTESMTEDGVWQSVDTDGETYIVERVVAE
jgi:hypothetical protein